MIQRYVIHLNYISLEFSYPQKNGVPATLIY